MHHEAGFYLHTCTEYVFLMSVSLIMSCIFVGDIDNISPEVHLITLKSGLKAKHKKEDLLDVLDSNLQRLRDSVPSTKSSLDEVTLALTQPRIHPLVVPDDHRISLPAKITIIVILIGMLIAATVIIVHIYNKRKND